MQRFRRVTEVDIVAETDLVVAIFSMAAIGEARAFGHAVFRHNAGKDGLLAVAIEHFWTCGVNSFLTQFTRRACVAVQRNS